MKNPGFEIGKRYVIWSSERGKFDSVSVGNVAEITTDYVNFKEDRYRLEWFDKEKYYNCWFCFEELTEQQELLLKLKAKEVVYV